MALGYSEKKASDFILRKFKDVGDSTLQEILNSYVRKDIAYSPLMAEKIFD